MSEDGNVDNVAPSMQKTTLITGANAGMGKATAIALAKKGMRVVIACRNQARGKTALADIRRQSGSTAVFLMPCDLASLSDIRRFSQAFHAAYSHLDILICNAGVLALRRQETRDGLELHFGVNHIGHFLLTNLLLDIMPSASRVVVVGSSAHKIGRIDFDNLTLQKGYSVVTGYSRSKLCNLLFVRELARRLQGKGITVNCAHPGAVATSIVINRSTGFGKTLTRMLGWIAQTPEQGAATAIYLATSDDCAGISGEYFAKCRIAASSKRSKDVDLAKRLWKASAQITCLPED